MAVQLTGHGRVSMLSLNTSRSLVHPSDCVSTHCDSTAGHQATIQGLRGSRAVLQQGLPAMYVAVRIETCACRSQRVWLAECLAGGRAGALDLRV